MIGAWDQAHHYNLVPPLVALLPESAVWGFTLMKVVGRDIWIGIPGVRPGPGRYHQVGNQGWRQTSGGPNLVAFPQISGICLQGDDQLELGLRLGSRRGRHLRAQGPLSGRQPILR
jgi:hypothetical protein